MNLFEGKNALVVGVANDRSIAWSIAQELRKGGAEVGFTYVGEAIEKRVRPLANSLDSKFIEELDVNNDDHLTAVFDKWKDQFGGLDILIHSVAYADKNDLKGTFYDTSRKGFNMAMETSVFSLVAMTQKALPLMQGRENANIVTLTYYGAEKVCKGYNVMGVAKAGLEASVRYLASDLGPMGIRVNAISAGPIKTLAASGINYMRAMLKHHSDASPLGRNVTQTEVGKTATYLCSELSSGVTGEVLHVDSGYHIVGTPAPPEDD